MAADLAPVTGWKASMEQARRANALGRFGLTPAETRLAEMLLDGAVRTEKEAAAAMGLSPNTVARHRRVLYRKLRISRRVELLKLIEDHRVAAEVHGGHPAAGANLRIGSTAEGGSGK